MNILSKTDDTASYASIPQYISSDIRSLFLENSEYMSFDMTEPDCVTIRLESDRMIGRILDGRTMLDLLTEYTSYTGRMNPLPDWVSDGLIANIGGGTQTVKDIVQRIQTKNIPLSAVFVHDWTGQRLQEAARGVSFTRQHWNWESDDDLYPEWTQFVKNLSDDQVRVLAYINPLLSSPSMKPRYKKDLFREASNKGFLVKSAIANSSDNQAYSVKFSHDLEAGILDLTNPDARTWFKQVLKDQVWETGISGKKKK
jgi:alpha-glucosidase (family GH31 glycosyl hydrolase)